MRTALQLAACTVIAGMLALIATILIASTRIGLPGASIMLLLFVASFVMAYHFRNSWWGWL
jgi:hypothetical protein